MKIIGPGKRSRRMIRLKLFVILIVLTAVMLNGCVKRVERQTKTIYSQYFPLNKGDEYHYGGVPEKAIVTGEIGHLYTITYYDSTDNVVRWEDYFKNEPGVTWKNVIYNNPNKISVFFEPSLPFGPWSNLIGDTLLIASVGILNDSTNSHVPIIAEFKIMAIETVTTLAGEFKDCIKMRRLLKTKTNGGLKISEGESFWWFAIDIGLVKCETVEGNRELIKAVVDGVTYP